MNEFAMALATWMAFGALATLIWAATRRPSHPPLVIPPPARAGGDDCVTFPRGSRRVEFRIECDTPRPAANLQAAPQSPWMTSPSPQPMLTSAAADGMDGFEPWAQYSISRDDGAVLRSSEAQQSYLTFCARNDYLRPLAPQEFGRRLRMWLAATHNAEARHSGTQGGTVYDGVSLAGITAGLANGAA